MKTLNTTTPETFTISDIVWKKVPNVKLYKDNNALYASSTGLIRSIDSYGNFTSVGVELNKEYSSTYLTVNYRDEFGKRKTATIHSLVCSAWHGVRPEGYVVNHKDGNKHNNRPSNLEWVTVSENSLHAVKTGLLKKGLVTIIGLDPNTDESVTYNSVGEFARAMGMNRQTALSRLAMKEGKVWEDGKIYTGLNLNGELNKHNYVPVIVKNYITNKIFIADSILKACKLTNTNYNSAVKKVDSGKLVNGCLFYTVDNRPSKWPYMYRKDVHNSIVSHNFIGVKVICRDYVTDSVYKEDSYTGMEKLLKRKGRGVTHSSIKKVLDEGSMRLIKSYVFKYAYDDTVWPIYSSEEIEDSLKVTNSSYSRARMKFYVTGEVYRGDSLNSLVKLASKIVGRTLYVKTISDNIGKLYAGFVFLTDDDSEWPYYSIEEAEDSYKKYKKGSDVRGKSCCCRDYLTGKVIYAGGARELNRKVNKIRKVNLSSMEKRLRADSYKLLNGFLFKYMDEDDVWPKFTDEEITRSLLSSKLGTGSVTMACEAVHDDGRVVRANSVAELTQKLKDLGTEVSVSSVRSRVVGVLKQGLNGWTIYRVEPQAG